MKLDIDYENLARLNAPFLRELEHEAAEVLRKGWYVLGEKVGAFEEEFSRYCGGGTCIGVASGLDALILALKALDFPSGTEVIVPSNTYIASILAVLHAGYSPVLVEPDPASCNIDPARIPEAVSPKTRALMITHLYGTPCEMDPILRICGEKGLALIEDCAQSHGARYNGQITGRFGIGAFSFYPTKNLGAFGDGGALLLDDPTLIGAVRSLRNYGSGKKYYNDRIGFNSRLDELQAALLRVKLRQLDRLNAHKRALAEIYFQELCEDVVKPYRASHVESVFHIFQIRCPRRDELRAFLLSRGIRTEVHYPVAPNRQLAMRGIIDHVHCPISEEIHATTLSLPISGIHTENDIRDVARSVNAFFR